MLHGMWNLPGSGIEPMSPAFSGEFFTTEPPRKPPSNFTLLFNLCVLFTAVSLSINLLLLTPLMLYGTKSISGKNFLKHQMRMIIRIIANLLAVAMNQALS